MTFSDADAQRMLRVVAEQVDRRLAQTQIRYAWGLVESVNWTTKTARVYLLGESGSNYSSGFRFLNYEGPVVGQPVLVAIHPNGDRWIERVVDRSGSAFPTSPATDQRFYHTGRDLEYVWDGARWVTTTIFVASSQPNAPGPYTASANAHFFGDRTYAMWIVSWKVSVNFNAGQDGSNHWDFALNLFNGASTIASWTSNGKSTGTWLTIDTPVGANVPSTENLVYNAATKVGSPGSIAGYDTFLYFRLVG